MTVLYKATEAGNIPLTEDEEKQIRADWKYAEEQAAKPKAKSIEDKLAELEKRVKALEKVSTDDKK